MLCMLGSVVGCVLESGQGYRLCLAPQSIACWVVFGDVFRDLGSTWALTCV